MGDRPKDDGPGTVKQYVLCLLAYLPAIAPSMSLGFSAVLIPVLKRTNNASIEEVSWIASSAAIATPFGCLTAGLITDKFGRVGALQVVNLVSIVGWMVIASAFFLNRTAQFAVLIIGRIITGFSTGLCSISPIYMAEVASTRLRPIFTTVSSAFYSLGILIVYIYGVMYKENWCLVAILAIKYPIISIVCCIFLLPETPAWLVSKNKTDKAKKKMLEIYGNKRETLANENIEIIINNYQKRMQAADGAEKQSQFQYLKLPTCYRPLIIMTTYFFFQQFSGVMVIVFYAIGIAKSADIHMDPYLAMILIGLARLFTVLFVTAVSRNYGRRITSIISGVGIMVSLYGLAIYLMLINMHLISAATTKKLEWLTISLIIMYVITSSYGFLTIPFAMVAEVYPIKTRGLLVGLTIAFGYVFSFAAIKTYPLMQHTTQGFGVFLFYGIIATVGTVFIIIFLPETKGKTLQEIEDYFDKK